MNRFQMFFVLYFFMTGLYGRHLIIGISLVGVIGDPSWRRGSAAVVRPRSRWPVLLAFRRRRLGLSYRLIYLI